MVFLLDFFKNLCPGVGFFSPGPAKFHKIITFIIKNVDFFTKSTFFLIFSLKNIDFVEIKLPIEKIRIFFIFFHKVVYIFKHGFVFVTR